MLALLLQVAGGGAGAETPPQAAADDRAAFLRLRGHVTLEGLVERWPLLAGLSGEAEVLFLSGDDGAGVWREVRIRCERARWGPVELGAIDLLLSTPPEATRSTLTVDVSGPLAARAHAEVELALRFDLMAGRATWEGGPVAGRVELKAVSFDQLTRAFPWLALAGTADVALTVGGRPQALAVEAVVVSPAPVWRGEPLGRVALTWKHTGRAGQALLRWGSEEAPVLVAEAGIPLQLDLTRGDVSWLDDEPHSLSLSARGLDPARLRPIWRAPKVASFTLDLQAEGSGTLDTFTVAGSARGELQDGVRPPLPIVATLEMDARQQRLELSLGDDVARFAIALGADCVGLRRRAERVDRIPLEGSLDLAVPLATLAPYLSGALVEPEGRLDGRVTLDGTLGQPDFGGQIGLERAALTVLPLRQRLRELSLRGRLRGATLEVDELGARSGPGKLTGSGQIRLEPTPAGGPPEGGLWSAWRLAAAASLRLDRFPALQEELPVGLVDGSVAVDLLAIPERTEWRITVGRTDVKLTNARIPEAAAIPRHPAVRILDWTGEALPSESFLAGRGHLHVELDLEEPIHVTGPDLELDLLGRLVLDRRDDDAETMGGLTILPGGRFEVFDNPFEVSSGQLTLAGGNVRDRARLDQGEKGPGGAVLGDPDRPARAVPLEPVIELSARGRAVDTHVLLQVRGPGRRPELVLLSSPALPEYQIMTLLITGRADAVDDRDGDVRRQVEKLVARFHNPSLSRQLYDRLGVDKLGLGFGSSVTQPILTVGKQLNRQLYVETVYHHNAPPDENEKEAHVEYRLDPQWTFDTVYGDAGFGSLGVFWQTQFGGPRPPAPPDDWGDESGEEKGPPGR